MVSEGLSAIPNLMLHIIQRQAAVRLSVTYSFSTVLFQSTTYISLQKGTFPHPVLSILSQFKAVQYSFRAFSQFNFKAVQLQDLFTV